MTTFTNTTDQIESIYVGYFGRAGDPSGTNFWVGQRNTGVAQSTIAASFAVQPEATSKYPYLANPNIASPTEFINQVYLNLFNRAADAAGLAYWTAQLTASAGNPSAIGNFILNVISGATGTDNTTIINKTDVAKDFTTKATNANTSWTSTVQGQSATELGTVTDTAASVTAAKLATDTFIATAPGAIIGLTINTDTLSSTATNATFNAPLFTTTAGALLQTLTSGDNLTSTGTGASLTASLNSATVNVTTNGIARFDISNVTAAAATAAAITGNMTGVTALNNVNSTNTGLLTVGAVGGGLKTALTSMGATVSSAGTGGTVAIVAAAALAGTADSLAINLTGTFGASTAVLQFAAGTDGAAAGTFATPMNAYESISVNSASAAFINLSGAGSGGVLSTKALTLTGAGAINVRGNAAGDFALVQTIDATLSTGGVTITGANTGTGFLNGNTALTSFKGGTGADSIDLSNLSLAQVQAFGAGNMEGGTGRDTLILASAAAATTTNLGNVSGFEIISVTGASAAATQYALSKLGTGVDTFALANANGGANTMTIINAPTAFTFAAGNFFAATAANINVTGPGGATDVFTLTGNTGATPAAQTFGTQTIAGYETLTETFSTSTGAGQTYTLGAITVTPTAGSAATLNLVDNLATFALTTGTVNVGTGTLNISGTGTGGFNLGATTASVINASGLNTAAVATTTGLTMTGAAAAAVVLTGSNGLDTILGSAAADTISAGAGNDLTRGNELGDTINVGSGTDTIFYVNNTDTTSGVIASAAALLASTGTDIVTGMATGDKIDLASLGNLVLADAAIAVGTTFAAAAANQALFVSGSYATGTGVFTAGLASTTNNDYLLQYSGGTATTTINTVVLVDIVGTVTAASVTEVITLTVV